MPFNLDFFLQHKGEANFTLSNIITSIVAFISGIIAAAFVAPEDLGVIQSVLLVQTYTAFIHLGVFNGINRNLAFYKAKGDLAKMQKQIDTSHFVSVINAYLGLAIGVIVILLFVLKDRPAIYYWSGIFLTISLVITPLTNHLDNTFRSGQQFGLLGNIKNIQAVVYAVFSLLPALLGYIGRIIAQVVNIIFGYIARWRKAPYKHESKGDFQSFKELVATGAPLLLSGYIWSVFMVSDKTYIATYLSAKDMGLYTISGYCMTLLMVVPTALNTLLYPKAATRYGQTGDKHTLLAFWKKSIILFSLVLIPLCTFVWFALPYCVEWFMPKYSDGVSAARITLLTCLTFIANGPSVVFGTLRRNNYYILAVATSLGLFWLIVHLFGGFFQSIESVAWLRFALSLVMMAFTLVYSYLLIKM